MARVESPDADLPEPDPLYKTVYLPRKFKIGIAIPPHNECDIFTQDIGLIAVVRDDILIGFNVAAGGGMGARAMGAFRKVATILNQAGLAVFLFGGWGGAGHTGQQSRGQDDDKRMPAEF